MKYIKLIVLTSLIVFASCTQNSNTNEQEKTQEDKIISEENVIENLNLKLESDIMTPEVLWSFGRLGDVQISPDKTKLLYGVSYYSKEQNKGNRELYTMNVDGTNKTRLTNSVGGEYNAVWAKNGEKIVFLSAESGSMQLWIMNADGTDKGEISEIEGGITGFKFSPDFSKIFYTKEVKLDKTVADVYTDLPISSGRVITDLMYRHWDTWVDTYSHIFVADFKENKIEEGIDIMDGEKYESPLKPFGGIEQINWTPDSKNIAYTSRKKIGVDYTLSTNSDIYLYNIDKKTTQNLTEGLMGYDINPIFTSDGDNMLWESMERDGYESDKNRLFILNFKTNEIRYLTSKFDQNVQSVSLTEDNKWAFFVSDWHATDEIYKMNLETAEIEKLTDGVHNYRTVEQAGDKLIATMVSMSKPNEIYSVNEETGVATELSLENKDLLSQLTMGKVESRWVTTTDNKQMLVWIIYPPHFDSNKKYPTLLYCEGGPQSTVSQFWSYRWNFQMMAANDYIIVAPNRRGLPGFGQEWNEQISGDYGGQNMKDYFTAINTLKTEPFINEEKIGAIGASYGGFSVYWLAGHNENNLFKAFIAHDGIFNLEAQYVETDEMWFANWDLGGAYWEKNNKIAQKSYANSPHKFVDKWNAPIMAVQGQLDYRIVASQGMSAFNAAKLRGIPAKLLYFPDENHWVLQPQNGILWQREFYSWLDKWLK
jgi:dipeptidyl aminopeptidase/acylaminoacyl peptidase